MYMSMGMTYEQFWDGETEMVRAYRNMYERKQRQENFNAWLIGRYVHDAFSVVYANAWNKNSTAKYPERPYPLTEKEDRERKEEEAKLRMERIFSYVANKVRVQGEGEHARD